MESDHITDSAFAETLGVPSPPSVSLYGKIKGALNERSQPDYYPELSHIPSSFFVNPSKGTPFENLYVSQQANTGMDRCFAAIATSAVPAREYSAPFA